MTVTASEETSAAAYRSPLLALPGAVEAGAPDAGVASHYGNPIAEQRRLARGGVVDLSHRGVVTVTGPDRLSWLDSMASQQLTGLRAGDSAEALLLDPNGRIEHVLHLVDDGETVWITVEAAQTSALAAWLDRMRFRLRVEVADRSADYAAIGVFGETALPLEPAAPAGVALRWNDPWPHTVVGGHRYAVQDSGEPWDFAEVLVERERLEALAAAGAAGVGAAGAGSGGPAWSGILALEALRIAAWRPRGATEVDERSIPHELDWLSTAVHLSKGCYRGQETVAKVHNLGHPPRRLVLLQLDGSEAVQVSPGDEVRVAAAAAPAVPDAALAVPAGAEAPEAPLAAAVPAAPPRAAGTVTSVGLHAELGPIALAVLRRSVDVDAPLVVLADGGDVAAVQEVIVPPEAGSAVTVDSALRRRGR